MGDALTTWFLGPKRARPERASFTFYGLDVRPVYGQGRDVVFHASNPDDRSINLEMIEVGRGVDNKHVYTHRRSTGHLGSGVYAYRHYSSIQAVSQDVDELCVDLSKFCVLDSLDEFTRLQEAVEKHRWHIGSKIYPDDIDAGADEHAVVGAYKNVLGDLNGLWQAVSDATKIYINQSSMSIPKLVDQPQTLVMKALGYEGVMFNPKGDAAHLNDTQSAGMLVFLKQSMIPVPRNGRLAVFDGPELIVIE